MKVREGTVRLGHPTWLHTRLHAVGFTRGRVLLPVRQGLSSILS